MKNSKLKSTLFSVLAVLTMGLFTVGCSKSDDNHGGDFSTEKNTYKITVSLTNVEENDFVSISFAGGTVMGKSDVWKVNGKERTGESAIGLGKNDFGAGTKTYVIETTEPVHAFANGVQIINFGTDLPVSYKIEKGGKVIVNEELTLSGDAKDFTKQYSF
ncbi:MAG: hypothetical protein LBI72_08470 [Flavobacteriaceae bacterium]|jgi:hypothetical protein|nr:hypothetical protein [Flavobacteriaceae bacterium]